MDGTRRSNLPTPRMREPLTACHTVMNRLALGASGPMRKASPDGGPCQGDELQVSGGGARRADRDAVKAELFTRV